MICYNVPVPKWVKTILAVLLLPFCVGAVTALGKVLRASGQADTIWVATVGGAGCWLVLFLLLPKPMRVYVFGHELTHALWAWLFGGKVKQFKVSATGGHVVVTRTNFLIVLAPYFFPFYVVLVVMIFGLGDWIWGWTRYRAWFHLLVGAAYAFHLTLTAHILRTRQSDITSQGYLFSSVIIFLGNVGVLLLGIPLLTAQVSLGEALGWWLAESVTFASRLPRLF